MIKHLHSLVVRLFSPRVKAQQKYVFTERGLTADECCEKACEAFALAGGSAEVEVRTYGLPDGVISHGLTPKGEAALAEAKKKPRKKSATKAPAKRKAAAKNATAKKKTARKKA